mgnify:CR=1 FL=1
MTTATQAKELPIPHDATALVGRILLAVLFLLAGIGKLPAAEATTGYIASVGLPLPGVVFYLTVALELLGGLALIVGYKTRYVALALGLFSIAAAAIFHNNLADQMQMTMFLKNFAIAGGMFMLALYGPGRLSIDRG